MYGADSRVDDFVFVVDRFEKQTPERRDATPTNKKSSTDV